jgi:hypothetical protein
MFKTVKKDADKLAALEQAVADKTTDLITARGEFREKREKLRYPSVACRARGLAGTGPTVGHGDGRNVSCV